ncbi:type IV toxin-antitoxin system AbiEi family antitoxin domain-containing protein [Thermodesulfovibrio yellowstonii]|uniref:type IV toxin-antitoxin system AbiEi family antitoxin domain-containing protein n=1 Tax=Thermodesulfovibrio yellowstonii TaxID=28262 RepID=UPI0024912518|nr:hypothetical protein [Thermodesulfovibrio islandicus]
MKYLQIKALENRLFFSHKDVAQIIEIKDSSAKVFCSRYTDKGLFIRLKKDFYILKDRWQRLTKEDFYRLSNILQVPSYISLMTALSFYGVTTQVQRGFYEAVCTKRTERLEIEGVRFNFYKIKQELYFDFVKIEDFFIATKEKAFLDAVYLFSFGKYELDLDSIDFRKLDMKRIRTLLEKFPEKTKKTAKKICRS